VGKSSLLKQLSSAKPDIAIYPFTTKELIIGHITVTQKYEKKTIQIIELPGLLDRPNHKRNKIEKQGIIALHYLPSLILFIVDASTHCGYDISSQLKLLDDIKKEFTVPLIGVENKVDVNNGQTSFFPVSAKTGYGVEKLKQKIIDQLL
jgi:nucleolar GTP-binding protein